MAVMRDRAQQAAGMGPACRWVALQFQLPDLTFLWLFSALFCTFITKHVKIPKCIKYANNEHVMQL